VLKIQKKNRFRILDPSRSERKIVLKRR